MCQKIGIFKLVIHILLPIYLVGYLNNIYGQQNVEDYRRSSLYSLVIVHPEYRYGKEIANTFNSIPIPEKFFDHNLNRRTLNSLKHDKKSKEEPTEISRFLETNTIARRLIAKWYNRDKTTGAFDMSVIMSRGFYDADYYDVERAKMAQRGYGILADAGEELIKNTFVIVNDIYYVDKEMKASVWADWLGAVSALASLSNNKIAQGISSITNIGGNIANNIAGFRVFVVSHLYQLDYSNDNIENFYKNYYFDKESIDEEKKRLFDTKTDLFRLKYIGSQMVDSGETSTKGVNMETSEEMICKVCTRALDKAIVLLQRKYDVFKVKVPLFSCDTEITAKIGMKEGVDDKCLYEVLERTENKLGQTIYNRVGVIQPIKNKIWDNRFMAMEEEADNAELGVTVFKKLRGGDFYPGMLIRESRIE